MVKLFQSSCLNGCFWKCKLLSTAQTRLFLCKFSEQVYYERLLSRFTVSFSYFFYQQKQPLDVFFKKTVFKNFTIFTGRHLRRTLSKTPILKNICERLPLYKVSYLCSANVVCFTALKRHSICDGTFLSLWFFLIHCDLVC